MLGLGRMLESTTAVRPTGKSATIGGASTRARKVAAGNAEGVQEVDQTHLVRKSRTAILARHGFAFDRLPMRTSLWVSGVFSRESKSATNARSFADRRRLWSRG